MVKHNRPGRVLQMAVLLDDLGSANALLDGENGSTRAFWDLRQKQERHSDAVWQEAMIRLETRVSQVEPYRFCAFFHHLLFVKR